MSKLERKIQPSFRYDGFGFAVILIDVPMMQFRGEWAPDINFHKLADMVLEALAHKPARLTGNEIRFIRHSWEMTTTQFAERFSVTHPAVLKWERFADKATSMDWATEKDIRLEILHRLGVKSAAFEQAYNSLVKASPSQPQIPLELGAMLTVTGRRRSRAAARA